MTGKELWASLLQEAIQGRLVEQRDDEPAVEQIGDAPEDVPFAIPEKWKWVEWGRLGEIVSAKRVHQNDWRTSGIPFYRAREIGALADGRNINNAIYISQELYNNIQEYNAPRKNDIMITAVGTLGKCYLVKDDDIFYYKDASVLCYKIARALNPSYFIIFMDSIFAKTQIITSSSGTTVGTITIKKANKFLIPLPPIAEQRRIVARLEELRPLVDEYGSAEAELSRLEADLPDRLRASLLQEAISGRLVEQRDDEPAVEQIGDAPEDVPFAIPEKWKWVTLGDVVRKLTDGEHKTPQYTNDGVPFISVKNISSGKLLFYNTKFISKKDYLIFKKRCNPERNDILLSKVGTTGVPAIVDTDKQFSLFVSVALLKLKIDVIFYSYLYYLLLSPLVQKQALENTRGVGNKNWVLKAIAATQIPLPPLAEQRRIVAQLEKLLPEVAALRG